MTKEKRIIDQFFAILADDDKIAGVAHLCKFLRCMFINRCDELCHFPSVVDPGPGGDFLPILKAVDDIELESIESGGNNLVNIVEHDLLPCRVPVFDFEIVRPFRVGSRHPAWWVVVPACLPIRPVIFGFANAQVADHQPVGPATHHVQFSSAVLSRCAPG